MQTPQQDWYIDDGTRVVGPLTGRELQDRALDGRLRPTDRVSPNRKSWREAGQIRNLRFPEPTAVSPVLPEPAPTVLQQGTAPDPDARPATPRPGEDVVAYIPGYQILGVLGTGACGVVYEARQAKLDRLVALKTVHVSSRAGPSLATRFEKEAVALGRLQHPNIVGVFDCGRHADHVYFAMEVLRGEDLGQRISRVGRLDERTAWTIARQTAAALAYARTQGIYHRDIKPANLFLIPMPTGFGLPPDLPMVKVTDFGLALTRQTDDSTSDVRLTAAGVVLGTPTYMAPEQFKSPSVDHRADIYSIGATVYHALTGELPFPGTTVWDVMMRKAEGNVPRPGPPVSDESADLVVDMMAADPADRPQTYEDLIARIDALPAMAGVVGASGVLEPPSERIRMSSGSVAGPKSRRVPAGLIATTISEAPEPPAGKSGVALAGGPSKRRLGRLAAVTAGVGLVIGAAVIGAVAVGSGSGTGDDAARRPPVTVTYRPNGVQDHLYNGKDAGGWLGQGVSVETDIENDTVLSFSRGVKRQFIAPQNFQLSLGFDIHIAETADVTACVPAGANPREEDPNAPRLVLRLTKAKGAVLGTLAGARGEFTPLPSSTPVPFPPAAKDSRPYLEVRLERTGGVWSAFFHGAKVGAAPDDGTPKLPELRIQADGPVRIDSAVLEELVPGK